MGQFVELAGISGPAADLLRKHTGRVPPELPDCIGLFRRADLGKWGQWLRSIAKVPYAGTEFESLGGAGPAWRLEDRELVRASNLPVDLLLASAIPREMAVADEQFVTNAIRKYADCLLLRLVFGYAQLGAISEQCLEQDPERVLSTMSLATHIGAEMILVRVYSVLPTGAVVNRREFVGHFVDEFIGKCDGLFCRA